MTEEGPGIRISPESFTGPARALGEAGQVLSGIAQDIHKVRQDEQETRAVLAWKTRQGEILTNAFENPDIAFNENLHNEELDKAKQETLNLTQDQAVKQRIGARIDLDLIDSKLKIKQFSYQKIIADRIITLGAKKQQAIDAWISEPDPNKKQQIFDELAYEFKNAVDTKVMTRGDYVRNMAEVKAALPELQIEWDIYNDTAVKEEDSVVLSAIKAGKDGVYAEVSKEQQIDLVKKSQQRIFQNNQSLSKQIEETKNIRHDTILDEIANGTFTLKRAEDELKIPEEQGGIPKKTLLSYQRGIERGVESDLKRITSEKTVKGKLTGRAKEAKKYLNMIDSFIDDKVDLWQARQVLADTYADGIVNPQEMKFLDKIKKNLDDVKWNRESGFIKNIVEGVKSRIKTQSNPSDAELALRLKHLLSGLSEGKDPDELQTQIVDEQLESDLKKISSGSRIEKYNPTTGQKIYTKDNGLSWYDSDTDEEVR